MEGESGIEDDEERTLEASAACSSKRGEAAIQEDRGKVEKDRPRTRAGWRLAAGAAAQVRRQDGGFVRSYGDRR